MWNRLRNVIIGVAQFRQGLKTKTRRSLSLSSETELDRVSRTSTESSNPEDMTLVRISNPAEFVPELIKLNDENYSGNIHDMRSDNFCLINLKFDWDFYWLLKHLDLFCSIFGVYVLYNSNLVIEIQSFKSSYVKVFQLFSLICLQSTQLKFQQIKKKIFLR